MAAASLLVNWAVGGAAEASEPRLVAMSPKPVMMTWRRSIS